MSLELKPLKSTFSIYRFKVDCIIPAQALAGEFYSISRTDDELSIVCDQSIQISGYEKVESDWRALRVVGTLDFGLTGILNSITKPLADNKISVFAISTFDTDYILIKADNFENALSVFQRSGIQVKN